MQWPRPGWRLQFGKNAADVGFDGGEVDNQGSGDLLVAFSLHTPEEWVYSEKNRDPPSNGIPTPVSSFYHLFWENTKEVILGSL
jgi:hypothetical protein